MKARQTLQILFSWKITKWDEVIELPMAQSNNYNYIQNKAIHKAIFCLPSLNEGWHCKGDQTDIHILQR